MQFCEGKFEPSFLLTIGVDFKTKVIKSGGSRLKLQLWDTAGQERFRTITPAYFRSAMGVLLIYDITNTETFNNVKMWMHSVEEQAAPAIQRILVGNKSDLSHNRQVPTERGKNLAAQYGIPFFETSAKHNYSVREAFMSIADAIRVVKYEKFCSRIT
ncbi:putative small GTP binding protein rab1a [Cardiosporidium cionae]|uniref:Small GTP binding protein rab1a n=1 Tax=Cardiosporidium cionae TaxID=476202 RepID=A0ABQ7JE05_9APIC|nr:putative small GTP binding protein rab1a [Cardiosporidium cionae]|eukprot:KAF8822104.1 putative small GTP binding protein rab1a [Cardiosporidium cionae]